MRRSLILALSLVLAISASPAICGGPPSPWPTAEEVARSGFAVWPEDSV